VPEWLERLKTEYYQRRISAQHLAEIHDMAIKAAVKDQELAGIDIVSDGELRRDNDVDYFLARIPGVDILHRAKADYFDYYDAEVTRPLPELSDGKEGPDTSTRLGLAADFRFTRQLTDRPVKFSFTGPFSLSRRIRDGAYDEPGELVRALARRLNAEARELAAAGANLLQIDEPFLPGINVEGAVLAVEVAVQGEAGLERKLPPPQRPSPDVIRPELSPQHNCRAAGWALTPCGRRSLSLCRHSARSAPETITACMLRCARLSTRATSSTSITPGRSAKTLVRRPNPAVLRVSFCSPITRAS